MIRKSLLVLALLVFAGSLHGADTILLKSGKKWSGTILGADDKQINLFVNDTTRVLIPHGLVESVFFDKADRLFLLDGSSFKCKVVRERFPDLLIITEQDERAIRLLNIKHIFYNEADSLLVSYLPATDTRFHNGSQLSSKSEIASGHYMLGLSAALAWPSSKNWSNEFITAKNIIGINSGLRLGYVLNSAFTFSAGYEYASYTNSVDIAGDSRINNHFVFAGLNWYPRLNLLPFGVVQVGIDAGMIKTSGNAFLYSFRGFDIDTPFQFAVRPRAGAQFSLTKNINILTEVRYLITDAPSIESPVSGLDPLELDLNMINLSLTALYYINW